MFFSLSVLALVSSGTAHDASANTRGRKLFASISRIFAARASTADWNENKVTHRASDGKEYCAKDAKSFTADCACFTHDNCEANETCNYKSGCQKDGGALMVTHEGKECKEKCTKAKKGYYCYMKEGSWDYCYVDVKRPRYEPCLFDRDCANDFGENALNHDHYDSGNCKGNGQLQGKPDYKGWCHPMSVR